MIGTEGEMEAERLAAVLTTTCADLVVAAWGATARGEMTRLSDLDLLCWNPLREALPELSTDHAAYLDLVTCDGDRSSLREWALTNATDLHAVMFARQLGRANRRTAQFAEVVNSLWEDHEVRAREVYHLVATSISVARLRGPKVYRPEKFALGATRCWSVLAECGQLATGALYTDGTEANLRRLAAAGLFSADAAESFALSMRLRRQCEEGRATFDLLSGEYESLGQAYVSCVRELLANVASWLRRNAPLTRATYEQLHTNLLAGGAPPAPPEDSVRPGEAEAMMRAFLARDGSDLRYLLTASSFRASWWLRHAAILNAECPPDCLRFIVDDVIASERWWADRNLILYAIRHPRTDLTLCARLRRVAHQLRPMDRNALDTWYSTAHQENGSTR